MNETLSEAVQRTLMLPLGTLQSLVIGMAYATQMAIERYQVDGLDDDRVPGSLREFLDESYQAGEEFINALCEGLGIE